MRCLDASLPALAVDFNRSVGSTGAAVSAYALSYSGFQLLHGPLGERIGIYRLVSWAVCLSAVAAVACACAASLSALVALRFVAGGIAAAIGPLSLAWVSRSSPLEDRAVALARMTAAAILGTAAGQAGGGLLSGVFGWPALFGALAFLFGVAGVALILLARSTPQLLDEGRSDRVDAAPRYSLVLIGRPAVARVLTAVAAEGFGIYLTLTYVGAQLHDRMSLNTEQTGLVLAAYGAGGMVFVLLAPRLIRASTMARRALAAGFVLAAGFIMLRMAASQVGAAAALGAIGFGFLMMHNVLQVRAADMAPEAVATSLTLFAACAALSQAAGSVVGGYFVDRGGSSTTCLMSAGILLTLGAALGRHPHRSP